MVMPLRGVSPKISEKAFIAENASIIGDVTVGEDSSIWFGAVLRGDFSPIYIGRGTSIQDNAVVHVSDDGEAVRVGDNCTVGHGAIVHCTSVGDNCLIGMGAVLLKGAVIGNNCIVAAGAVVKERERIPDNTMVAGVPARVIRTLSEAQTAELKKESDYVALAREYLSRGK